MHQKIAIRPVTVVCFRQWSNKAWAIFNSLGRVVKIGNISGLIENLITVKSSTATRFLPIIWESEEDAVLTQTDTTGGAEGMGFASNVLEMSCAMPCFSSSSSNQAPGYFAIILSIEMREGLFRAFFYLSTKTKQSALV